MIVESVSLGAAMPRRQEPEEDEDWDDEEDLPDGVYDDDDEELPTVKCPHCGNEVVEDAPYCPRCETYLSKEDRPAGESRSWFVTVMLILAVLIAIAWAAGH